MTDPILITRLERTCTACPSQWEGEAADGAVLYLRYRGGHFRLHRGPVVLGSTSEEVFKAAVYEAIDRDPVFEWESDDGLDGWMSDERLLSIMPEWIDVAEDAIDPERFVTDEQLSETQDRVIDGLAATFDRIASKTPRTGAEAGEG